MIYIKPIEIGNAQLISSTVSDAGDPPVWNPATSYAVGDLVSRDETHRIYACKVAGIDATAPEDDSDDEDEDARWEEIEPTNIWACFDRAVNTQSEQASGEMVIVVAPGDLADSAALLEVEADEVEVVVTDGLGGPEVYNETYNMVTSVITDAYQYCFEPFTRSRAVILRDLPPYLNAHITVTLRSAAGPTKLGAFSVGTSYSLGGTQYGAQRGVIDKSKKVEKKSGVIKLKKGLNRKTMRLDLQVDNGAVNQVDQLLTDALGTVAVFIGIENLNLEPFVALGFINDFYCTVKFPTYSAYSVSIQGMN